MKQQMFDKLDYLISNGKTHEAIKEIHALFFDLVVDKDIQKMEEILQETSKKEFDLNILTSFLTASVMFKDELPSRKIIFDEAEKLAIKKYGKKKLKKSIFYGLK